MGTSCVSVTTNMSPEVKGLISWNAVFVRPKLHWGTEVQPCDVHVYLYTCECVQLENSSTSCLEIKCISCMQEKKIYSTRCHKEVALVWFSSVKETSVTSNVIKLPHLACISDLMLYKKHNYPKKTPLLPQCQRATKASPGQPAFLENMTRTQAQWLPPTSGLPGTDKGT